jgi:L-iditol 2-dehydrogenase
MPPDAPGPIPATTHALVSPAVSDVALVEVPVPAIGPGEVLLQMEACGLCGTDRVKVYTPGGARPFALGHEVVGRIAAVGNGVTLPLGTRVGLAHHVPDPASHHTRRGSGPMDAGFRTSNIEPCGFAGWVRVPAAQVRETLLPLPPDLPTLRAVFLEPLACCLRALDRVALREGDTALVVGVGATGLLFVPLLRDRAVTALAADRRPERLPLAQAWGAHAGLLAGRDDLPAAARAASAGRGADLVILTVVTPEVWTDALAAVRDGGTILLFGAEPGAQAPLDLYTLWRREVSVVTSYSSTPEQLPRALALLQRPTWALETTVSHCLPLAQAAEGFALAHAGRASKVVLYAGTREYAEEHGLTRI